MDETTRRELTTPVADPGVSTPDAAVDRSIGTRLKTQWRHVRHVLASNPVSLLAFVLFVLIVVVALLGPWITPYDPLATNAANALKPPSWSHWFGTDQLGRDVLSRVVIATRLDLMISGGPPLPRPSASMWSCGKTR